MVRFSRPRPTTHANCSDKRLRFPQANEDESGEKAAGSMAEQNKKAAGAEERVGKASW